jgi:serine/threonine protein kinase
MAAPVSAGEFLSAVGQAGLLEEPAVRAYLDAHGGAAGLPEQALELARAMVRDGLLTPFQAQQLLQGKTRGFLICGKYKLLKPLGRGGMGAVFLCEHTAMRRRVALKLLPAAKAQDPGCLERFYREAQAVAALDHPNIVRAHDIDHENRFHFLVLEYVDGTSLQELVQTAGPLDVPRACHYICQAALGLQHAHEAGVVHRDVKPGNLLVDRGGTVKILDMGLARFFRYDDGLTKENEESVLGTTDYLAPEQALDSKVDARADIYSLGATFYFLLTGRPPFGEGTAAQKLVWAQLREPEPICALRPEVPEEVAAIIEHHMLAKDPAARFQQPAEVAVALEPWAHAPSPTAGSLQGPAPSVRGPREAAATPMPSATHLARHPLGQPRPLPPRPPSSRRGGPPAGKSRPDTACPAGAGKTLRCPPAVAGSARKKAPQTQRFHRAWRRALAWAALGLGAAAAACAVVWWAHASPTARSGGGAAGPQPTAPGAPGDAPPPGSANIPEPVAPGPERPPGGMSQAAPVSIQTVNDTRHIRGPSYEAVVEADGCVTSLRVSGVELLRPGLDISRGAYCHQEGTAALPLPIIEQPAPTVVTARGELASVRYEFGPEALTWTVTNVTDKPMSFFLVFAPAVTAAAGEGGEWARAPAAREWRTVTWYAGRARLTTRGGDRVWPWFDHSQVFQASLAPRETRKVVLEVGTASDTEQAQAAAVSGKPRPVRTPAYEAVVESDGCLTSLRVGGQELLWVGGAVSRGCYFYQENGAGRLSLPTVEQPADNVITARGELAAVRYDFAPDALTWTLSNPGKGPLRYYIVFGDAVRAVANDKGEWAKTPVTREWPLTTWYAGAFKVTLTGGTKIWGPWEDNTQVWQADVGPGEQRRIVLRVAAVPRAEAARVAALVGGSQAADADLAVTTPKNYQVFQRYSRLRGQILLQGRVRPFCDKVEVRLTGDSLQGPLPGKWQDIPCNAEDRSFDAMVPTPAGGWYKMEVRALRRQEVVAEYVLDRVGVGEVFVGAGQSNETNCSEERLKVLSGMVATFSGDDWRMADDPQPGVQDRTGGGSFWPAFGDAVYAKYRVPVGVVSLGYSGSSVVQWQKGSPYYRGLLKRLAQLGPGGFRGLLWHQGESDVRRTAEEYCRLMTSLIEASRAEGGWDFPWFVAQVSYLNPHEPSFPTTRAAQKKLWDNKVALEGPDTDTLTGDNRDDGGKGIHFSGKGQRAHGRMWAEKVGVYLDKILASE